MGCKKVPTWKVAERLLSGALVLLLTGCSYFNAEEDKKQESIRNPKPSAHSMLRDIKMTPLGTDNVPLADKPAADLVLEPDYYRGHKKNWSSLSSDLKNSVPEQTKFTSSVAFNKVFPDQDASAKVGVSIRFDNTALVDVLPAFANVLKFDYILDPAVQTTVTMTLNTELTREECWDLVQQLIWMAGGFCDWRNNVVYIRPMARISQEFNRTDSSVMMKMVTLENMSANEMRAQLQPFLTNDSCCMILNGRNTLLLVDTPQNMERLLGLIGELDRNYKAGWYRVVMQCDKVAASKVRTELASIMPVLGYSIDSGTNVAVAPGAIHLAAVDRLQVLVATAASPEPLTELMRWVMQLNDSDAEEQTRVYIYKVENNDAKQLLQILALIFNIEGNSVDKNGNVGGITTKISNEDKLQNPNSSFVETVRAVADITQNQLIFRTTARTYGMIRALLERIDEVPPQVLLQVMVAEIELSDSTEFGLEFSMEPSVNGEKVNMGTNYADLQPGKVDNINQLGGKLYITDPSNANQYLYMKALASRSKLKVVSSPQILLVNNTTSKVQVGKEVPLLYQDLTDTQSSNSDNTTLRRTIRYQSTGVQLEATPTITRGGLITLRLKQTISDAQSNTTSTIESPMIKSDIVETTLSLRSGQTAVMGGLIKEKHDEITNSIPILADIPWLSWLTGNSSNTLERTEILLLVTAMTVNKETTLDAMIKRYNEATWEIYNFENNLYRDLMHQQIHDESIFDLNQTAESDLQESESGDELSGDDQLLDDWSRTEEL